MCLSEGGRSNEAAPQLLVGAAGPGPYFQTSATWKGGQHPAGDRPGGNNFPSTQCLIHSLHLPSTERRPRAGPSVLCLLNQVYSGSLCTCSLHNVSSRSIWSISLWPPHLPRDTDILRVWGCSWRNTVTLTVFDHWANLTNYCRNVQNYSKWSLDMKMKITLSLCCMLLNDCTSSNHHTVHILYIINTMNNHHVWPIHIV